MSDTEILIFCMVVGVALGLVVRMLRSAGETREAKKYDLPSSQTKRSPPRTTSITSPKTESTYKLPPVTQVDAESKPSDETKRRGRQKEQVTRGPSTYRRVLQIRVPQGMKWEPARAERLIDSLYGTRKPFNLVVRAKIDEIAWYIEAGRDNESAVTKAVYSLFPEAQITTGPKIAIDSGHYKFQYECWNPFILPMKYAEDFAKGMSPMASLLSGMTGLNQGEEVVFELAFRPPTKKYREMARDLIFVGNQDAPVYIPELQKPAEEKLEAGLLFETITNVKVKTGIRSRAREIADEMLGCLGHLDRGNINGYVTPSDTSYLLVLSPKEVAAHWHLPTEDCLTAGIVWARAAVAPLPTQLITAGRSSRDGIVLGSNTYQSKSQDVRLGYPDRITHVNLIGRTRVGKSTLMHNMIERDIANGKGVAVIDPHGDLVKAVLECSIPTSREQDVVLFDITDTDYPIGLNLLSVPDGVPPEAGANQALEVIRKMFADEWHSGRMENVLYASLISLVTYPGATIQDVTKMPINSEFRSEVLKQVTDITALEYWYDIHEGLRPRAQLEVAQPIVNRIQRFYREPTMRRIICQKDSMDFGAILNGRKIFLANLGGLSDIENETLGALLISKIQMAAMSRTALAPEQRVPFYCYIDEVQNFVTTSLGKVFSEAAKYGLSLTVANQFLSQLTGDTLDAIIGNVGTTVMFRCGHDDARLLGRFVKPQFGGDDLLNLDRYTAIVKMQHEGETMPAFNLVTIPPPEKKAEADAMIERIQEKSRKTYARPREEIDAELAARYTGRIGAEKAEPETEDVAGSGTDGVDDSFLG